MEKKTIEKNEDNKIIEEKVIVVQNEVKEESKNSTQSLLEKYKNLSTSSALSDTTKAYLNSYISSSRPELSDFSKQFLNSSDNIENNSRLRPELSNITKEYLFSQITEVSNESET